MRFLYAVLYMMLIFIAISIAWPLLVFLLIALVVFVIYSRYKAVKVFQQQEQEQTQFAEQFETPKSGLEIIEAEYEETER